ncbi:hypothetical protein LX36DRAFT_376409 [Colletotrichum falcatum]|nr:hypothetical protein LX36DRAFT_376409 [Colletotrichum falcatum]
MLIPLLSLLIRTAYVIIPLYQMALFAGASSRSGFGIGLPAMNAAVQREANVTGGCEEAHRQVIFSLFGMPPPPPFLYIYFVLTDDIAVSISCFSIVCRSMRQVAGGEGGFRCLLGSISAGSPIWGCRRGGEWLAFTITTHFLFPDPVPSNPIWPTTISKAPKATGRPRACLHAPLFSRPATLVYMVGLSSRFVPPVFALSSSQHAEARVKGPFAGMVNGRESPSTSHFPPYRPWIPTWERARRQGPG